MQKQKCQIHIQRPRLGHLAEIHGLCLRENDNMLPQLAINSAIHCQPRDLPDFSNEFSMPITSISSPPTSPFTPEICFSVSNNAPSLCL